MLAIVLRNLKLLMKTGNFMNGFYRIAAHFHRHFLWNPRLKIRVKIIILPLLWMLQKLRRVHFPGTWKIVSWGKSFKNSRSFRYIKVEVHSTYYYNGPTLHILNGFHEAQVAKLGWSSHKLSEKHTAKIGQLYLL